jgi:hypothetical protein
MLDNELGQGKFKKLLKQLSESMTGVTTNREIMDAAQNAEVLVVTTLRPNKEKTKVYMDIDSIVMA